MTIDRVVTTNIQCNNIDLILVETFLPRDAMRTAPFSITLNGPSTQFQGHFIFLFSLFLLGVTNAPFACHS